MGGAQIEYGQPPPLLKRRPAQRRIIYGTILLVLLSAFWWGKPLTRNLQAMYWERKCMAYTLGPDVVVYDDDPSRAAALAKSGDPSFCSDPRDPTAVGRSVPCWSKFRALMGMIPTTGQPVLFCHARQVPGGGVQLVVVDFSAKKWGIPPSGTTLYVLVWRLYTPEQASFSRRPMPNEQVQGLTFGLTRSSPEPLRFFAGQPDPIDSSHFTIKYELGQKSGTIDGYLRSNGKLDFSIRDGPAKVDGTKSLNRPIISP